MIALAPANITWFQNLRDAGYSGLVNFWTSMDWKVSGIAKDTWWYFVINGKLAGGGRFEDYAVMRVSEAWARFGFGNGAGSVPEMVGEVISQRQRNVQDKSFNPDPIVGCIALRDCVFLPDEQHALPEAHGLSLPGQLLKYKLLSVPPLRLVQIAGSAAQPDAHGPVNKEDVRLRIQTGIANRRGPELFRRALLAAYDSKCPITGCNTVEVLEAAHIVPYLGDRTDAVANGLLLRADIHTLFDLHLLALTPKTCIVVLHPDLRLGHYAELHGRQLRLPQRPEDWPDSTALAEHLADAGFKP